MFEKIIVLETTDMITITKLAAEYGFTMYHLNSESNGMCLASLLCENNKDRIIALKKIMLKVHELELAKIEQIIKKASDTPFVLSLVKKSIKTI